VPGLRQRREDIPELATAILTRIHGQQTPPTLTADALAALQAYRFPGNVRELENILERASALCEDHRIGIEALRLNTSPVGDSDSTDSNAPLPVPVPAIDTTAANGSLETFLEGIERQVITQALEACRWNRTAAAEKLGLSFRALRYRLKKLGID